MCMYPGSSWWSHENNPHVSFQPPQRFFDNWGGSSVPGYAPSAPASNLSYGNYYTFNYPLPPPSMQQQAPIRAFGPHEAPRPCFNNWYGTSNHGYSQQLPHRQLPPRKLNAYGSCSDYKQLPSAVVAVSPYSGAACLCSFAAASDAASASADS